MLKLKMSFPELKVNYEIYSEPLKHDVLVVSDNGLTINHYEAYTPLNEIVSDIAIDHKKYYSEEGILETLRWMLDYHGERYTKINMFSNLELLSNNITIPKELYELVKVNIDCRFV